MAEPVPIRAGAGGGAPPAPSAPDTPSPGGGGGIKAALTRKIGPLPAWGWAIVVGGAGLGYKLMRGGGTVRQEVPTTNLTPGASPTAGYLNELSVALKRIEDAISKIPNQVVGTTPPASSTGGSPTTSPTTGTSSPSPTTSSTTTATATSPTTSTVPISAKAPSSPVASAARSTETALTRAVQQMPTPKKPVSSVKLGSPQTILQGPTAGLPLLPEDIAALRRVPATPVPPAVSKPTVAIPPTTRTRRRVEAVVSSVRRVVTPAPRPAPPPPPKRKVVLRKQAPPKRTSGGSARLM